METFRPTEIKEYYIKLVTSGMNKYFSDNIFTPIFNILSGNSIYNYNPYYNKKGQFCSKSEAIQKIIKDIKPVNIKSSDIPFFGKRNHKGIRAYVIEAFKQNRNVTIESTKREVLFTKDGAKRASQKQNPSDKTHNAFYTKISDIVKRAKFFDFIPADQRHKDKVKGQEIYYSRFNIDNEPYIIKIAVDVPLDKYIEQGASYNYAGHRVNKIEVAPARIKVSVENQHSLAATDAITIITYVNENLNPIVNNSKDDLIKAIKSGKVYYKNGAFRIKDKFNNSISKTLEELGAVFKNGAYYIKQSLIPVEYIQAITVTEAMTAAKLTLISKFLNNIDLTNIILTPYIKDSVQRMFKSLEKDIVDAMQEKKVPVIELDIVQPKVQLPKEQTLKIEDYWKNYDISKQNKKDEIKKAKDDEKKGKNPLKSSEELSQELTELNKKAFENAPKLDIDIDKFKLNEQSEAIARDYIYNMEYWVKKWEAKNIVKMRQDIADMVKKGARLPEIQEYFEKRWNIAKDKAFFLAKNESHLAGSVITKTQYQKLGCTKFEWGRSSAKEKRELHKQYYGKVFSFDDPPIIDEKLGIKGLPRQIWNCLCHMEIVVPTAAEIQQRRETVKNSKTILGKIKNAIQHDKQCNNQTYRYERFGER